MNDDPRDEESAELGKDTEESSSDYSSGEGSDEDINSEVVTKDLSECSQPASKENLNDDDSCIHGSNDPPIGNASDSDNAFSG